MISNANVKFDRLCSLTDISFLKYCAERKIDAWSLVHHSFNYMQSQTFATPQPKITLENNLHLVLSISKFWHIVANLFENGGSKVIFGVTDKLFTPCLPCILIFIEIRAISICCHCGSHFENGGHLENSVYIPMKRFIFVPNLAKNPQTMFWL